MKWWQQAKQFLTEVWTELTKTSWPVRREVFGTTLVVVIMVLICSVFLWGVDFVLQPVSRLVYPTK